MVGPRRRLLGFWMGLFELCDPPRLTSTLTWQGVRAPLEVTIDVRSAHRRTRQSPNPNLLLLLFRLVPLVSLLFQASLSLSFLGPSCLYLEVQVGIFLALTLYYSSILFWVSLFYLFGGSGSSGFRLSCPTRKLFRSSGRWRAFTVATPISTLGWFQRWELS